MNNITINNQELSIKQWNGQRVVTFADIDRVHEKGKGTAKRAFNRNKKHLIQNEDYFIVKPTDLENTKLGQNVPIGNGSETLENTELNVSRSIENQMRQNVTSGIKNVSPRGTTFLTESGYLMIAKVFDDDLAWEVQRSLVNSYFRLKDVVGAAPSEERTVLAEIPSLKIGIKNLYRFTKKQSDKLDHITSILELKTGAQSPSSTK